MNLMTMDSGEILQRILAGERIFPEEANFLCSEADLLNLAMAAREVARRQNPEGEVGYALGKTIRYSNICQPQCPFCQGTVTRDHPTAFTKTAEEVGEEAAEAAAVGATQITLQGGHRIDLPWTYYTELVAAIKERCPAAQILAYSPSEIMLFATLFQKRTVAVVDELQRAGMSGLLAGGDESLSTRIPEHRLLLRGPWTEWFDVVHRCADAAIPVVAPAVFGIGETVRERVGHLYRVRAVQERTARMGKPAFRAVVAFSPVVAHEPAQPPLSGHEYLRMLALTRLLVSNVAHLQSSFVTQGAKVAQIGLDCGADDLGTTHMEYTGAELAAGRTGAMSGAEMERLILETGRRPVRRSGW